MVSRSYVIPCAVGFRDAVLALAERRRVSAADLARSVMLLIDRETIDRHPDPGEPPREEREIVVVQSGASSGRTLRRKPRLQVRLDDGLDIPTIRRALDLALAMDRGEREFRLDDGAGNGREEDDGGGDGGDAADQDEEVERLNRTVRALFFAPLEQGVRTRAEALYVLGFPPTYRPDIKALNEKFRFLAKIHHPDSPHGDHLRMAQLNDAMQMLRSRMVF